MPPGYSARCAACGSQHRPEIDRRLLSGESTRAVSSWLSGQGESISHSALGRHKREHLAVAEAIADRAAAAAEVFEKAVDRGLSRIQVLEEQARELSEVRQLAAGWIKSTMTSQKPKPPPMAVVALLSSSSSECRQAIAQLQKVLGEEALPTGEEDNELARRILADSELSRIAHDFLERAAEGDPSGDGIRAEWAQVDTRQASQAPE